MQAQAPYNFLRETLLSQKFQLVIQIFCRKSVTLGPLVRYIFTLW